MQKDIFEKFRTQLVENLEERVLKTLSEKQNDHYADVEDTLLEGIFKRVNRIRGGKIQRRKKIDTRDNYRNNGDGTSTRMTSRERRNRKLSQRKGARKRKATKAKAIKRRKKTLRKRNALGFNRK